LDDAAVLYPLVGEQLVPLIRRQIHNAQALEAVGIAHNEERALRTVQACAAQVDDCLRLGELAYQTLARSMQTLRKKRATVAILVGRNEGLHHLVPPDLAAFELGDEVLVADRIDATLQNDLISETDKARVAELVEEQCSAGGFSSRGERWFSGSRK